MASYNLRKLSAVPQICNPYCDPNKKIVGTCPPDCVYVCDAICNHVVPSEAAPPPKKLHKLPLVFKISLAVLIVAFFLFCCYTIYKFYTVCRNRSRNRSRNRAEQTDVDFVDEDYGPVLDHPIWYIRTVGLQPGVISAITICKYKKDEGLVEGTDCSVCLSEFQEDETLRLLPKCNHAFHIPCIDTWLRSHTNCPLCRAGIVRPDTGSVLPELINPNLAPVEETQVGVLDIESLEPTIRDEESEEFDEIPTTEVGDCVSSNVDLNEVQRMRRSVSFDSSAAAIIGCEKNLNTQLAKVSKSKRIEFDFSRSLRRLVGTSSVQKGSGSMIRSSSCGEKFVLPRQNGTPDSPLPQ
jgi:hypothetical protein